MSSYPGYCNILIIGKNEIDRDQYDCCLSELKHLPVDAKVIALVSNVSELLALENVELDKVIDSYFISIFKISFHFFILTLLDKCIV